MSAAPTVGASPSIHSETSPTAADPGAAREEAGGAVPVERKFPGSPRPQSSVNRNGGLRTPWLREAWTLRLRSTSMRTASGSCGARCSIHPTNLLLNTLAPGPPGYGGGGCPLHQGACQERCRETHAHTPGRISRGIEQKFFKTGSPPPWRGPGGQFCDRKFFSALCAPKNSKTPPLGDTLGCHQRGERAQQTPPPGRRSNLGRIPERRRSLCSTGHSSTYFLSAAAQTMRVKTPHDHFTQAEFGTSQ